MGIKNIWSLTIDEALVADELKNYFKKKNYEVFFPINAQLKDIDLILFDLKHRKAKTIQVKGSRTYNPSKSERERYGEGSAAWITLTERSIYNPSNKIDFFIFVLHSLSDGDVKKKIILNYLIFPSYQLKEIVSKKIKGKGGTYHFYIWIDTKGKRSFDFNNPRAKEIVKEIPLSKYLDNWELIR